MQGTIQVFARLVCSCYMSQNEALYGAFLECDGLSVREFCLREVLAPRSRSTRAARSGLTAQDECRWSLWGKKWSSCR
jgi:hypothetical protein